MKKKGTILLAVLGGVMLTACGGPEGAATRVGTQNAVEKALNEGVEKAASGEGGLSETSQGSDSVIQGAEASLGNQIEDSASGKAQADVPEVSGSPEADTKNRYGEVDIDLTKMNSDMVYATVYQLMMVPESYEGKVVKMKGSYYSSYNAVTDTYYHMTFISDAAACCAQGIEFVWDDGSHGIDEYPDYYAEIEVTGIFTTYTEEGDSNVYCTLKDATMKLAAF